MLRARIEGRLKASRLARWAAQSRLGQRVREQRTRNAWAEGRNVQEAADALVELIQRKGHKDPTPRYRLARIYDKAGMWHRANVLLMENLERHPRHVPSQKLLADTAASMQRWAGALDGSIPDRANAVFQPGVSSSVGARTALERALELQTTKPGWRAALAELQLADGDYGKAINAYENAAAQANASLESWALGSKQRWQFGLERAYFLSGAPRVDDPLFRCSVESVGPVWSEARPVTGLFDARFLDLGLSIEGFLVTGQSTTVNILVDGARLRTVVASEDYLPTFTVLIKRSSLARFPIRPRITVTSGDDERLATRGGGDGVGLTVPHGDNTLSGLLAAGVSLNKKGEIRPSPEEELHRHEKDLDIYVQARDFFDQRLGRPLFLIYGTLLGCYREGGFIPGDDDFDVGYVSDAITPEGAKREAMDYIVQLVRAGFTVSFNRRGRLFRIHLDSKGASDRHIDVQFIWFQDRRAFLHNQACLPLSKDDFLPPRTATLRGVDVWLPRDPEAFLSANYGPQWHVPDPGFRYYPGDVDPNVLANLGRSLITVSEYKNLARRVEAATADAPDAGRLVSIGSQDLYPLEDFII